MQYQARDFKLKKYSARLAPTLDGNDAFQPQMHADERRLKPGGETLIQFKHNRVPSEPRYFGLGHFSSSASICGHLRLSSFHGPEGLTVVGIALE